MAGPAGKRIYMKEASEQVVELFCAPAINPITSRVSSVYITSKNRLQYCHSTSLLVNIIQSPISKKKTTKVTLHMHAWKVYPMTCRNKTLCPLGFGPAPAGLYVPLPFRMVERKVCWSFGIRPLPIRASRWPHASPPPARRRPASHPVPLRSISPPAGDRLHQARASIPPRYTVSNRQRRAAPVP